MSPRVSSSSSGTGSGQGTPQFTFVTENKQSEARSHAMRQHWKGRHKRKQESKTSHQKMALLSRTLLPQLTNALDEESSPGLQWDSDNDRDASSGTGEKVAEKKLEPQNPGIPAQLFCGMSYALSSSRPDPFQTCPVHLTSKHQKLLYHCAYLALSYADNLGCLPVAKHMCLLYTGISTHAAMMFEDLEVTEFNPMRDVWFPLDLSNASSFNCIMAHSAAHLAHLYGGTLPRRGTTSSDALNYKIEAVRILRLWLSDPATELCDDAFAAVVRLLTFERYWGTVKDWKVHRDGLQRMINAKGGVEALHENWRLELVVYLVSLMSRPSWLESTNSLDRISHPLLSTPVMQRANCLDVQKIRCLWLISFIQDMRTFMGSFYSTGLSGYPIAHAAVELLRQNFQNSAMASSSSQNIMEWEEELLSCLFSLSVLIQDSISVLSDGASTTANGPSTLDGLEIYLRSSQDMWMNSVYNLRIVLFESLAGLFEDGASKMNYVTDLVQVLGTLSLEARQGVEKCLLNLLNSLGDNKKLVVDDCWTPDSLLSSMHGH